jgi:hypothetical protein
MTAVYNQAKRSPCTLRFHVATEGAWDVGAASGCLLAALLSALGVPISVALLLPLVGAAALFVLLRNYYAGRPLVTEIAVAIRWRRTQSSIWARAPSVNIPPSAAQIVESQSARACTRQHEEPTCDGDVFHEVDHLAHVARLIVEEPGGEHAETGESDRRITSKKPQQHEKAAAQLSDDDKWKEGSGHASRVHMLHRAGIAENLPGPGLDNMMERSTRPTSLR